MISLAVGLLQQISCGVSIVEHLISFLADIFLLLYMLSMKQKWQHGQA